MENAIKNKLLKNKESKNPMELPHTALTLFADYVFLHKDM